MIAIGTFDIDLSSAPLTEPDKIHLRLNQSKDECDTRVEWFGTECRPWRGS